MEKLYKKIGWKNKPNLSTPLGATNLGKIDEALDGLDNRTIEMNESIATNRRNIEILYANVNKNTSAIEVLTEKSNDIDMLKIVSTASGSPAYMEDASNMGLEGIDFFGESKQLQTTGKNLFGFEKSAIDVTEELRKLDNQRLIFTKINDNSIKCNYSWGTYATGFVELNGVDGTKNYAFSFDVKNNTLGFTPRIEKYTQECTSEKLVLSIYSGSGATEVSGNEYFILENIQVEAGTTVTPYEPYTGGKASPNPDYPQPIESNVVSYAEVHGKNELNCSGLTEQTISGVTFTPVYKNRLLQYVNVNGTCTASSTSQYVLRQALSLKDNEQHTLNGCPSGGSGTFKLDCYYTGSGSFDDTGKGVTFTARKGESLRFRIVVFAGATLNNAKFYPMLRQAIFTDATYEPYQSQTAYLSGLIALNGIGDVKDTDKLKKFGVVVLNGTEAWYKHDEQYPHLFKTSITPYANGNVPLLCSHFPYDSGDLLGGKDGCRFRLASSADVFYISSSKHTDVSALKSWLASNPITVVYELAEPIETALSQADIDAIKALHSYKPNTVVMNNGNAEMDVHYVADAKTYIDKKFEALASAIVNQ